MKIELILNNQEALNAKQIMFDVKTESKHIRILLEENRKDTKLIFEILRRLYST